MKILVVDDEKLLVKGIKFNLENDGYEVDAAYDGEAAVELARTGRYDLIILDLMMPKLDGLSACMQIREFSNVPVIMLTAKSEDTDKLLGFEYGADDYVTKPFNVLELKARVRALLRRSGAGEGAKASSKLVRGHITIDSERRSAEDGVHNRMYKHVGVRVAQQPSLIRYVDAAEYQFPALHQAVYVVAVSYPEHQ